VSDLQLGELIGSAAMRGDWPSLTAIAVAFGRGLGTDANAPDPHAGSLLPAPLRAVLRAVGRPGARAAMRAMSFGMVDHVCLRTAAIDAALQRAIADGCDQLVILGAGLDARAWRMPDLHATDVYEVDHPSTQAGKRDAAGELPQRARSVAFVAVDFERERVGERLAAHGHDVTRPTAWIWEGVTPYLHPSAIAQTLDDVATRSAAASVLMMTYAIPEIVLLPIPAIGAITRLAFRGLGEALFGAMAPADAAAMVEHRGFAATSDTDARAWAEHAPGSAALALPFRGERLLVATR
jgi:methyltransferase (TIGR00027 family)